MKLTLKKLFKFLTVYAVLLSVVAWIKTNWTWIIMDSGHDYSASTYSVIALISTTLLLYSVWALKKSAPA